MYGMNYVFAMRRTVAHVAKRAEKWLTREIVFVGLIIRSSMKNK